jgi:hypothetical protein
MAGLAVIKRGSSFLSIDFEPPGRTLPSGTPVFPRIASLYTGKGRRKSPFFALSSRAETAPPYVQISEEIIPPETGYVNSPDMGIFT